jgi:hypothetical protein
VFTSIAQKAASSLVNDGGNVNLISLERLLSFDLEISLSRRRKKEQNNSQMRWKRQIMRVEGSLRRESENVKQKVFIKEVIR